MWGGVTQVPYLKTQWLFSLMWVGCVWLRPICVTLNYCALRFFILVAWWPHPPQNVKKIFLVDLTSPAITLPWFYLFRMCRMTSYHIVSFLNGFSDRCKQGFFAVIFHLFFPRLLAYHIIWIYLFALSNILCL